MKLKMYSLYAKIISFCLTLLGFSSCAKDSPGENIVEYGTPSASYKVTGKVVGGYDGFMPMYGVPSTGYTKKPIKNIRVVMIQDVPESSYFRGDTVFTNAEGKFEVTKHEFPHNKYKIKLQDVDGSENGLFNDQEQTIEFKNSDYKGGHGGWNKGEAKKDMGTIEMTPKQGS